MFMSALVSYCCTTAGVLIWWRVLPVLLCQGGTDGTSGDSGIQGIICDGGVKRKGPAENQPLQGSLRLPCGEINYQRV